jgi:epothilone synthetase B
MTSRELLQDLEHLGVRAAVRGDNIHLRGPKDANTPALRERVRAHKAELLSLLASRSLSVIFQNHSPSW